MPADNKITSWWLIEEVIFVPADQTFQLLKFISEILPLFLENPSTWPLCEMLQPFL